MYIPRLRRINDAIREIKQKDPNSVISWKLLQYLIKEEKLTAMWFGNSWLVNLDELYGFFKKGGKQ